MILEIVRQYIYFVQLSFHLSNWQKVQLNTDLFSDTQKYLYTENMALLKSLIK